MKGGLIMKEPSSDVTVVVLLAYLGLVVADLVWLLYELVLLARFLLSAHGMVTLNLWPLLALVLLGAVYLPLLRWAKPRIAAHEQAEREAANPRGESVD
jgi:type VI protein secretion system component VasK